MIGVAVAPPGAYHGGVRGEAAIDCCGEGRLMLVELAIGQAQVGDSGHRPELVDCYGQLGSAHDGKMLWGVGEAGARLRRRWPR